MNLARRVTARSHRDRKTAPRPARASSSPARMPVRKKPVQRDRNPTRETRRSLARKVRRTPRPVPRTRRPGRTPRPRGRNQIHRQARHNKRPLGTRTREIPRIKTPALRLHDGSTAPRNSAAGKNARSESTSPKSMNPKDNPSNATSAQEQSKGAKPAESQKHARGAIPGEPESVRLDRLEGHDQERVGVSGRELEDRRVRQPAGKCSVRGRQSRRSTGEEPAKRGHASAGRQPGEDATAWRRVLDPGRRQH